MATSAREPDDARLRERIAALERRRDELAEALARYQDLYDGSPDLCASVELGELAITDCNRSGLEIMGYERGEVIGRPMTDFVDAADLPRFTEMAHELVESGGVDGFEYNAVCKDGTRRPISLNANLRYGADGRPVCTRGVGRDVTAQRKTEAALRRSEARFRRLAETMRLVPWLAVIDPALGLEPSEEQRAVQATDQPWFTQYRPDYVGRQIEATTGFPRARWYEPGFWVGRIHEDDRQRVIELAAARAGEPGSYATEYRILDARGEVVWVLDLMNIVKIGYGRHLMSGVVMDVSATKRDAAARDRLMHERSHRVKNTFATVQAIADQTLATAACLDDFVGTFDGRIRALGAVHNAMAATDWTGIELRALADLALAPYAGAREIVLEGPGVKIGLDSGRTLGMVFHELATNAVKHGALSSESGSVRLEWSVRGSSDAAGVRLLALRWVESGGPAVAPPRRRGYGLDLIERSADYELEGVSRVTFREEGLECDIEIPLGGTRP